MIHAQEKIVHAVCGAAFAALLGMSGAARAQSSVTLYGVISVALSYSSNAGGNALWSMASGPQQPSRWGLKGKEDLGGSLTAIFDLENGFSATSGSAFQGGRIRVIIRRVQLVRMRARSSAVFLARQTSGSSTA